MWPAIAAIAASVIGGVFNAKAQKKANQANVDLWREQTAYNSPEAQMERLKAAGLSPNLVYGQVASARAADPPDMHAENYGSGFEDAAGKLSQYYSIRNQEASNELILANVREARARARGYEVDAEYKQYEVEKLKKAGIIKGDSGIFKNIGRAWDWLWAPTPFDEMRAEQMKRNTMRQLQFDIRR